MAFLSVENLSYTYEHGTAFSNDAITDITFSAEKGEVIGIIGHTGSGKSTLVQHINGLLKPTSGKVLIDNKDIWENPKKIRDVRFRVGLVFQYPEYQLFEETAYKDIAFGPTNMGLSQDEIDRRVLQAADIVQLPNALLNESPFDLSGGEKRRVAIAGVIAMRPEILILDEPTAGLDPIGRSNIISRIMEYRDKTNAVIIIVSHSMEDMAKIADKLLVMNESRLAMFDTKEKVFSHSEELLKMGLDVPQITKILLKLKSNGINVATDIFTVKAAAKEIAELFAGRTKK